MAEMAAAIEADANIKVYLNAITSKTSGAPGRFEVEISTESGATATEKVGAIVQATGFTLYDANKLPELGYGKSANVVDQAGLEALAKAANGGPIKRPSDGGEVKSVVFVQCAGQRDETGKHLPYCSGSCCLTSVKQAMYFKDANPDIDTVVIYTDLRMPGNGEDFYRSGQNKGVTFTKGKVSSVEATGNQCKVNFQDLILNDQTAIDNADLVVLATGQVPNSGVDIDTKLKAEIAAAAGDNSLLEAYNASQAEGAVKPISMLNLTYRQGPDVPQLKYGFTDSHFICFPYETRRTGIYSAGPVRRPMDMVQAMEDATGAAMKAIQAVENAALGPRRASAFGRPVLPQSAPGRLHPVQALHGGMPVRRHRRGREALPAVQRVALPPLRHLHGRLPGARDLLRELLGRYRRFAVQGGRRARRVLREAAHPDAGLRKRRLPGARHGGDEPQCLQRLRARHPGALPGFGQHHLDHRRAQQRLRRRDDDGLQARRRLPVPLRQGLRACQLPHEQDRRHAQEHGPGRPSALPAYEVAITDIERVPQLINDYAAKIQEIGMSPLKGF